MPLIPVSGFRGRCFGKRNFFVQKFRVTVYTVPEWNLPLLNRFTHVNGKKTNLSRNAFVARTKGLTYASILLSESLEQTGAVCLLWKARLIFFPCINGANVYTRILDSGVPINKCTNILFRHLLRYQIPLSPVPCLNASQTIKRKKFRQQ